MLDARVDPAGDRTLDEIPDRVERPDDSLMFRFHSLEAWVRCHRTSRARYQQPALVRLQLETAEVQGVSTSRSGHRVGLARAGNVP